MELQTEGVCILDRIPTLCHWLHHANIPSNNRVLVGTRVSPTDCFLVHVIRLSLSFGSCCCLLSSLEECKKVNSHQNDKLYPTLNIYKLYPTHNNYKLYPTHNNFRMSKDRYYDAGSIASLKHYPGDFDHMGDNLKYGRENMEMSPAMSHSSMRTGKTLLDNQDGVSLRSIPGATIQPSPSTHSLRSLGLRPVAPPVPNHGPPSVISGMQIPSRGPSSMGRPQSIAGGQMQDLSTQALQKSLPPTPAVTPAMLHKGLQGLQGSQRGMPVTQTMTQSGFAVGPGEIPNGAGPFVNGGLHNTSDDSILTNQSSVVGSDPRGSRKVNMDQSLESIGGTKYPTQVQPMTQPRPHTKLVPGRMSQNSGQQQRLPKSPGPQTRQQAPSSRPDSRASGRQTRGIIPSTAV